MTTQSRLKQCLEEIKKNDKKGNKINAFLQLRSEKELIEEAKKIDEKIKKGKAGKLAGKIIGIKANILVKGLIASCASKTLENFKAPYDSTVVKKIKEQDGLIIGILNMDEFASGASGETSAFGPTNNPAVLEHIPGGSSSGPAAAIAAGFCDMALGSDTGGSIRNPASHCGIVGIKPTHSLVSRYGLIDLAMSTDTIGSLAKNVDDAELLLNVIKGRDSRDAISQEQKVKSLSNKKIAILDYGINDKKIQELIDKQAEAFSKKYKIKIDKVKIPYLDLAVETYYPLVYVEAFSGTRKFDGRRFGKKIEDSCGPEFLRRILGGKEISKAEYGGRYYYQSLKAKKLIEKEFEKIFEKFDILICPTVPRLPHKIGEKISIEEMYSYDVLTTPISLAGCCAISVPAGKIGQFPVGIQIVCGKFQEKKMLEYAKKFEKL